MKLYHRIICFSLTVILLVSFPLTSFAAAVAVPSVADYIFDMLLSSSGVDAGLQAASSWLGSWSGYDDYAEKGKRGELGAYSQYLYDIEHSNKSEEFKESARRQIDAITSWMDMDWTLDGGKEISLGSGILNGWVDGVKGTAADYATSIKGFLSSFSSYGTASLDYIKKVVMPELTEDDFVKPSNYGDIAFSCSGTDDTYSNQDAYYTYYYSAGFSSAHKPYAVLYHYLSNYNKWTISFYYVSGTAPSIGKIFPMTLKGHKYRVLKSTGAIVDSSNFEMNGLVGTRLSISDIKNLPFPVFTNEAAGEAYASSLILNNVYNQSSVGLPVANVNQQAQTTEIKTVPIIITLPQTGEQAAELQEQLDSAMDRIEELEAALKNAGLDIGWGTDVVEPTVSPTESAGEGVDTETKTTLAAILAKVEALPVTIEALFDNKLEPENVDKDVENMKLPVSISDKFPFCIPFDVAYLVKSMNAASEVPRFELPFKIHYLGFNYEHTFIVDMSDWDAAVKILRTMLDLLFIAGLISVTRDLIRG